MGLQISSLIWIHAAWNRYNRLRVSIIINRLRRKFAVICMYNSIKKGIKILWQNHAQLKFIPDKFFEYLIYFIWTLILLQIKQRHLLDDLLNHKFVKTQNFDPKRNLNLQKKHKETKSVTINDANISFKITYTEHCLAYVYFDTFESNNDHHFFIYKKCTLDFSSRL